MVLLRNLADEGRAGEPDDGVLDARISYYLAAPEIIRLFLKEWKYFCSFSALKISYIQFYVRCIFPIHLKGARRFVAKIFKLKDRSRAILSENDQRSIIPIPARAMVTLVSGDIDADAFVKIRYEGRVLLMLSEDLRSGGELLGQSTAEAVPLWKVRHFTEIL